MLGRVVRAWLAWSMALAIAVAASLRTAWIAPAMLFARWRPPVRPDIHDALIGEAPPSPSSLSLSSPLCDVDRRVDRRTLACLQCGVHIAAYADVLATSMTGKHGGPALLVRACANVVAVGAPTTRTWRSGPHTVVDVVCRECQALLGCQCRAVAVQSQRHHISAFLLDQPALAKQNHWSLPGDPLLCI